MLPIIYLPVQQVPPKMIQLYDGGLRIEAEEIRRDLEGQYTEAKGHVVATYGPDRVTAERLVIHDAPGDGYVEAFGKVELTDPEGTVSAENIRFSWKDQTGTASDVLVRFSTMTVTAKTIDIGPNLWTLTDVGGTACTMKTPLYYFRTRKLTYRPGIGGTAEKPQIYILGKKIATLPTQNFGGENDGESLNLPIPQYRPGQGFGVAWKNELDISASSAINTDLNIYQRAKPNYSAYLVHSFAKDAPTDLPRSELNERSGFGYFDSIQVHDPTSEASYLRRERSNLGIGFQYGTGARDTTNADEKINKPIEAFGQWSGQIGEFGFLGILRGQEVRLGDQQTYQRFVAETNLGAPLLKLAPDLTLTSRLDTANYFGDQNFSWQRAQVGLVWQPIKAFRAGAAYVRGWQQGTELYPFDRLYRDRELNLRADLDLEQTQLRVMFKFDPGGKSLFDQEIYFSQVLGCLEPFIVYRKSPRKFFIGLKLPIGHAFDRLAQRQALQRKLISGPAPKL